MVRFIGCATVTLGGEAVACFSLSPQPASRHAKAIAAVARGRRDGDMRLERQIMPNRGYIEAGPSAPDSGRAFVKRPVTLSRWPHAPHIRHYVSSPPITCA